MSSKGSLHGWGTGTGKQLSAFTTHLNSFHTLRAPQNCGTKASVCYQCWLGEIPLQCGGTVSTTWSKDEISHCELSWAPWVCPASGAPAAHPRAKEHVWMETVRAWEIHNEASRDHSELPAQILPQEDVLRNRGALNCVQSRPDPAISPIHVPQKTLPWPQGKEESNRFAILEIRQEARVDLFMRYQWKKKDITSSYRLEGFAISSKREISNGWMAPKIFFSLFPFLGEILVNVLKKTEPT